MQDDDARYQCSVYQQKRMKSASKMTRGKVLNEETSQVEGKLPGSKNKVPQMLL